MPDDEIYRRARARVRQLRALYLHVAFYVIVIGFLVLINAVTRDQPGSYMLGGHMYDRAGGDWWVIWPAMAWGVVVALHAAVVVLGSAGRLDSWEERKIDELVRREKEKSSV